MDFIRFFVTRFKQQQTPNLAAISNIQNVFETNQRRNDAYSRGSRKFSGPWIIRIQNEVAFIGKFHNFLETTHEWKWIFPRPKNYFRFIFDTHAEKKSMLLVYGTDFYFWS